jgi:hypothetical protein
MALSCDRSVPAPAFYSSDSPEDAELWRRITAEFREMPGLMLTLPQAARLFSLDARRCERVLQALVHAQHLTTNGELYAWPGGEHRHG